MRMSEPLPLSRSPLMPWPARKARWVAPPTSKTVPSALYLPSSSHARKRTRMSSSFTVPSHESSESSVASMSAVSSEYVPAGCRCAPPPTMPVQVNVPRSRNS